MIQVFEIEVLNWKGIDCEQIVKTVWNTTDYIFDNNIWFSFEEGNDEPVEIISKTNIRHIDVFVDKGPFNDMRISFNIEKKI